MRRVQDSDNDTPAVQVDLLPQRSQFCSVKEVEVPDRRFELMSEVGSANGDENDTQLVGGIRGRSGGSCFWTERPVRCFRPSLQQRGQKFSTASQEGIPPTKVRGLHPSLNCKRDPWLVVEDPPRGHDQQATQA